MRKQRGKNKIMYNHKLILNTTICSLHVKLPSMDWRKKICSRHICGWSKLVTDTLDQFESQNLLSWHKNAIPENAIWLKVRGDHGKGSLKLSVQNCKCSVNQFKAQHIHDMHGKCKTKDGRLNLRDILRKYRKEIDALHNLTWKGKQIKLHVFRDYDFSV